MTLKTTTAAILVSAALVTAPLASASAHDHWHRGGGGGLIFGLGAAVGALAVGIATIATAPLQILAGSAEPPRTADAPPAYAPNYAYAPRPAYYPPPVAYYPPPQRVYYYSPPGYAYAPPPGYYYPQR